MKACLHIIEPLKGYPKSKHASKQNFWNARPVNLSPSLALMSIPAVSGSWEPIRHPSRLERIINQGLPAAF